MNERNKDAEEKTIALFLALTMCQAFGYEVLKLILFSQMVLEDIIEHIF